MSNNSNNKTNEILPKFPYTAKPVSHSLRINNSEIAPNNDKNSLQSHSMPRLIQSGKPAYWQRTHSLSSDSSQVSSEDEDDTLRGEEIKQSILLDSDAYKFVYSREEIYAFRESFRGLSVPEVLKDWPFIFLPDSWEMEVPSLKKARARSSNSESMDTRARHINIINEELRKNEMVFSPQRRSFVRGCVYPVSSAPPRSPSNVYEYAPGPAQSMEAMSARGQRYVPPHERGPSGPPPPASNPRPPQQKGVRPSDADENWRGTRMRRPGSESREYEQHGGYRRRTVSGEDPEPEWMLYGPQSCTETIELKGMGTRPGGREGRHGSNRQEDEGQFSDEETPEWLEFGPVSQTECVELRGLRDEAAVRRRFLRKLGDSSQRQSTSSPEEEPEWVQMELTDPAMPKKKPELLNNLFGNVSLVQNPTAAKPLPVHAMTLDQLEQGGSPRTESHLMTANGNNPINAMNNMAPRVFSQMPQGEPSNQTLPSNSGLFQQLLTSLQMQKQGQVVLNRPQQPQQPPYKDHSIPIGMNMNVNMNVNMNLPTQGLRGIPNALPGTHMPVQVPYTVPNSSLSFPKEHSAQAHFPPLQRPIVPRLPSEVLSNPQTNEKVESRIRDLFKVKEAIIQEPLTQEEKIVLINRIDENIKQLRALALKLNDPNSQAHSQSHTTVTPNQSPLLRPQMTHHTQSELTLNHKQMTNIPLTFPNNVSLAQASNNMFTSQAQAPLGMTANSFPSPPLNPLQNQNVQQHQPIAFLQQLLARNMTPRAQDMQLPMVGPMGRGMAPPYNYSPPNTYPQRPPQPLRPPQNTIGLQPNFSTSPDLTAGDHMFGNAGLSKEQTHNLLQMQGAGPPVRSMIPSPLYHDTMQTQK